MTKQNESRSIYKTAVPPERMLTGKALGMPFLDTAPVQTPVTTTKEPVGQPAAPAAPGAAPAANAPAGVIPGDVASGLAAPRAAAASAAPPPAPTIATPQGQPPVQPQVAPPSQPQRPPGPQTQVYGGIGAVTPLGGPSEPTSENQRKITMATAQAQTPRQRIWDLFGYKQYGNDPQTGAPLYDFEKGAYVPTRTGQMVMQNFGSSIPGQSVAQWLDQDQPGARGGQAIQELNNNVLRFIEPILRLASGATILPPEYSKYWAMFIPNANDGDQAKAEKLQAMALWEIAAERSSTVAQAQQLMEEMSQRTNNQIGLASVRMVREDVARSGQPNVGNRTKQDIEAGVYAPRPQ